MEKYNAFYLDGTLLIRIINKETTKIEKHDNTVVLYNGDQIIGYNLFDFKVDDLKDGLVPYCKYVEDSVNERLAKINQGPLELMDVDDYFIVGYVEESSDHPESSKLHIAQVDLGDHKSQIVCGAKNIEHGQKVVVAIPGAVLNDGTWISKGKLLKVESNGMICSDKELGLSDVSHGILVLDANAQVGSRFFDEN